MSLRLISLLLFALLYCCQSEELEEAALQNSSGLVRNQAIVFQNKEDSVFKVKSTTTRRNVRTTSTTEHSFALPSTSKPVNINHKNKRPSSQTTTTTRLPAPAEIISTTTEPVEKLKNDTADRIGNQNSPENGANNEENCNCVRADECASVGTRIVTPEGECPIQNHIYCCVSPHRSPPPTCGIRPNFTIPEVSLKPGQAPFAFYPWNAALLDADTNVFLGGGVLLDNIHILTAAHKLNSSYKSNLEKIKVRLGEWDASGSSEPHHHQDFGVSEVTVNPDFNSKNLQGDLAILTLGKAVALRRSPHITAVCVPRLNSNFVGQRCWVSGWGKNAFGSSGSFQEIMKHVDVPIIDSNECEERLRDTKLSQYFQLDRRSFICAGGDPEKDACTGDGGSPLVCESPERPNQFYLVGLVAWGIGCATSGVPGVYVNVAGFSDWISDVTSNFKNLGH